MTVSLVNSGMGHPDHEWSRETMAREAELIRQAEAVTLDQLEAMDFVDLCLFVGLKPSRFYDMLKGIDRTDEIDISAAIRNGIHAIAPDLDDHAHLFIRHLYRPVLDMAEAAE
jgi:hypothetical protein